MIDDLRALAVFATTVERSSFREAARVLQLSPSVVSHHVAALERRLGVALLYRTTRRLSLTAHGERLYRDARDMVLAAERGLDALRGAGATPAGTLRISAPAILVDTPFLREIAAFSRAYPRITCVVGFTEQRRDLVREALDLAIRIGTLADSSNVVRKLASMARVLVASPAYVATRRPPRGPADLEAWDILRLAPLPPEIALCRGRTTRTLRFQARLVTDSAAALRALACADAGVAALPALVVRADLAAGRLVEVLPAWRVAPRDVYAAWPGGTPRPELVKLFLDFVEPRLRALFGPTAE